jgi:hypothetical protein
MSDWELIKLAFKDKTALQEDCLAFAVMLFGILLYVLLSSLLGE